MLVGWISGASVHQFVNEWWRSCSSWRGQLFISREYFDTTKHKPYVSGMHLCQSKSGDTVKKSVTMDTKMPTSFLSDALYNSFVFPVIYLFVYLFM